MRNFLKDKKAISKYFIFTSILVLFFGMIVLGGIALANPDSVWTTDGVAQQKNAFDCEETVYLNGDSLTPSTTLDYDIYDQPSGGNVVASGSLTTDANGDFSVVPVWTVPADYLGSGQHKAYVYDAQDKTKTFYVVCEPEPADPVCGNQIVEIGEQCEANEDCREGYECTNDCTCEEIIVPECKSDSDCEDGSDCTLDKCIDGSCEFILEDSEGPTTSDVVVERNSERCTINIHATETDTCSNIETAEYYLGGSTCEGTPEGTLNAEDGSFDELIEDIVKNNVIVSDGSININIRGKDVAGNWGPCETVRIDVDCIPPNYPTCVRGDENPGISLNGICNPDELLVCDDDPLLKANICDDQSRIQLAEYFLDEDNPLNWLGIPMLPTDGEYDELCEDVESLIDVSELEDGTHYVQLHGKDGQENWGKFTFSPKVSFIVDTTAPTTKKKITFFDDKSLPCEKMIQPSNGHELTDGCYYALPGTQIELDAYDPDPQQTGEFAGDVVIHYIVWWSLDGEEWQVIDQGESNTDESINFTLNEDSYHLVEYWATDGCGLEERHHYELDIIDSQAPRLTKEVGKPSFIGENQMMYITQDTPITFTCTDLEPHPVNLVTIEYRTRWKEDFDDEWGMWGDWQTYHGPETEFNFREDSMHEIEYRCYDALGNQAESQFEVDIVDTQAPITTKEVLGPKFEGSNGIHWFLTDESTVVFDCQDQDPHPVDDVTLNWKMWWRMYENDEWELVDSGSNDGHKEFTNFSGSYHKFEYWCEDALGNEEEHQFEIDAVDTQAPHTTKRVGEPNVLMDPKCNPEEEICDYWITQDTPIYLSCKDVMPHPIGNVKLYWRDYLAEEVPGEWNLAEDGFAEITKNEDCLHVLEWYCEDALGNSEGTAREPIVEHDNVDTAAPEVRKFVIKDGERIYSPEEGTVKIGVQGGETLKFCAEVNDVKQTGDEGVGVWNVFGRFTELDDPELIWDETEQAYCVEKVTQRQCGYWHYEVRAKDLLGNEGEWTDGIEIIIDNVPPVGEVLNPHAGNSYYAGKIFPFYAPAVDFGGNYCTFDLYQQNMCHDNDDCPASGVDYCDVYAIDYDFEALDQTQIKQCWEDLDLYFEQVLADPYMEYIGRVPYEDGVCNGYLTIPEDTRLTDTVFMAVKYVDKAGNSRFGLALNPWISPITMNMEEIGNVQITEMFDSPAEGGSAYTVRADLSESDLAGTKECFGTIERYPDDENGTMETVTTPYVGMVTGNAVLGYECVITGVLPSLSDGNYKYTVLYRLNDDWQVFDIGSDYFDFFVGTPVIEETQTTPVTTGSSGSSGGSGGSGGGSSRTSVEATTAVTLEPETTEEQTENTNENTNLKTKTSDMSSITGGATGIEKLIGAASGSVISWIAVVLIAGVVAYFVFGRTKEPI